MRILVLSAFYLPGYKGGGPIRSLASIVQRLGTEFSFSLMTSDRDLGDGEPYSGVVPERWQTLGKAEVCYLPPQALSVSALARRIRATHYDLLYLNSFFTPAFAVKPLLLHGLGRIATTPVILAPRGEFSPGALAIKRSKKRAFIALTRALRLYRGVLWQASSEHEERDIRSHFGADVPIVVAPNLPGVAPPSQVAGSRPEKGAGTLRVMFLSRVSRKKNLVGALEMLDGLRGDVEFNIFGPLEDGAYWDECQTVMSRLPQNVRVQYRGSVEHDRVPAVARDHDLFLFPTHGENFGHVILEALVNGCPVLLSDQTPWRNLNEKGVGWDLPLGEPEAFRRVLQEVIDMDAATHGAWSHRATEYGREYAEREDLVEQTRLLFQKARVA